MSPPQTCLLLLVSGPIRQKLWIAGLAFWGALLASVVLGACLAVLHRHDTSNWPLPLRGRWLRSLMRVLMVTCLLFFLFLFVTSGLGFFALFPGLAR